MPSLFDEQLARIGTNEAIERLTGAAYGLEHGTDRVTWTDGDRDNPLLAQQATRTLILCTRIVQLSLDASTKYAPQAVRILKWLDSLVIDMTDGLSYKECLDAGYYKAHEDMIELLEFSVILVNQQRRITV